MKEMDSDFKINDNRKRMLRDEKLYFKPILKMLKDNGGELASSQDINDLLPKYTDFTEDEVNYSEITKKGNNYHPSWFGRNFALVNLREAGLIDVVRGRDIKLTPLGQSFDIDALDLNRDIYAKTAPYWEKKNAERKLKLESKNQPTEEISDNDEDDSVDDVAVDDSWVQEILDKVKSLSWQEFERFCRGLLKAMKFDIDDLKGQKLSGDFGIDGFGYKTDKDSLRTSRVCIQCKSFSSNHPVSVDDVNSLRGAIDTNHADYGILMTTSYFSDQAHKAAKMGSSDITLIDGNDLVQLMAKLEYKVHPITIYKADAKYFDAAEKSD